MEFRPCPSGRAQGLAPSSLPSPALPEPASLSRVSWFSEGMVLCVAVDSVLGGASPGPSWVPSLTVNPMVPINLTLQTNKARPKEIPGFAPETVTVTGTPGVLGSRGRVALHPQKVCVHPQLPFPFLCPPAQGRQQNPQARGVTHRFWELDIRNPVGVPLLACRHGELSAVSRPFQECRKERGISHSEDCL